MNWENFAPTYRAEYCEFSGIDPATCEEYTEDDMVEHVWGGRENAEATRYRVGPLCSNAGMILKEVCGLMQIFDNEQPITLPPAE